MSRALRIGTFAAFYGDRRNAVAAFRDEDVDVLIGDYLAELTMLVLKKNMLRGRAGYASGFLDQIGPELSWIAERGIKVVVNAGGLDPLGCGRAVEQLVADQGLSLRVAVVSGDDITPEVGNLRAGGHTFANIDTGDLLPVDTSTILTANAYLGAWPLVAALDSGADIVIAPRVTDAALVLAPAAWHHGWAVGDWNELAGAVAAGHAIECGSQATGGNFCFFDREGGGVGIPAMPIAEIREDGSAVITKSAGGGLVTIDTVTAQMLYEVGGPDYHNPDVIVDWTSITLSAAGPDRVLVDGTVGRAPTSATKVSLCYEGGYRNSMTLGLTGPAKLAKAAWFRRQFHDHVCDPADFDDFRISVVGATDDRDPASYDESTAWMTVSARAADRSKVDRVHFSDRIVELGVSTFPGCYFTTPPTPERLVGVQWPCLVPKTAVQAVVHFEGENTQVPWGPCSPVEPLPIVEERLPGSQDARVEPVDNAATTAPGTTLVPLGTLLGTRSGDKAGMANLGVWVRDDRTFDWLTDWLSVARLQQLLPELRDLHVDRTVFPRVHGLNFVVRGLLGEGTSATLRLDTQAKGLGEYLRAKHVRVPTALLVAPTPAVAGIGA